MATWADLKKLALALPEAEESTTYRKPAFKVGSWLLVAPKKLAEAYVPGAM